MVVCSITEVVSHHMCMSHVIVSACMGIVSKIGIDRIRLHIIKSSQIKPNQNHDFLFEATLGNYRRTLEKPWGNRG